MKDDLGDRMKLYENTESDRRFMPLLPICARLDGRSFSRFTQGLKRPYDERMSALMQLVTDYLVDETQACIGYTQSDEISLVWHSSALKHKVFFDGRIQKMCSVLAAMASAQFNKALLDFLPEKQDVTPVFDARVWQVPNQIEAANVFLWRELDATKNSISMAAHHHFGHHALMGKNGEQKMEMLFNAGINWNDYPTFFKRGSYFQKRPITRKFTTKELESLPEKHDARKNPDLVVTRSEMMMLELPPLSKILNRVGVIFEGAQWVIGGEL
jgi:tRNA(His) 5'-end guanylyltransferase